MRVGDDIITEVGTCFSRKGKGKFFFKVHHPSIEKPKALMEFKPRIEPELSTRERRNFIVGQIVSIIAAFQHLYVISPESLRPNQLWSLCSMQQKNDPQLVKCMSPRYILNINRGR